MRNACPSPIQSQRACVGIVATRAVDARAVDARKVDARGASFGQSTSRALREHGPRLLA